jgi:excisionase family DNA binding protein
VTTDSPALPQLLTVKQAAQVLAVSPRLVYRLLNAGHLQGVRVGGAVRVSASDLREYVERNRTGQAAAVLPIPAMKRRPARPTGFVFFPPSRPGRTPTPAATLQGPRAGGSSACG